MIGVEHKFQWVWILKKYGLSSIFPQYSCGYIHFCNDAGMARLGTSEMEDALPALYVRWPDQRPIEKLNWKYQNI